MPLNILDQIEHISVLDTVITCSRCNVDKGLILFPQYKSKEGESIMGFTFLCRECALSFLEEVSDATI